VSLYTSTNVAGTYQTTEPAAAIAVPFSGTVKNLSVYTNTTQSSNNSLVATVYVNGGSTGITTTIPSSGVTGVYADRTNTQSITANQTLSVQLTNNANANSAAVGTISLEIVPTTGTPAMIGGAVLATPASGSTNFWQPFTNITNATETNVRTPLARAGTTTNLCVNQSAGTANQSTLTLVKNGSATALAVTTINGTGVTCATGSVAWAQGDTMTLKIAQVAGAGPTISGWSVDY
jgi:hypothetical protein